MSERSDIDSWFESSDDRYDAQREIEKSISDSGAVNSIGRRLWIDSNRVTPSEAKSIGSIIAFHGGRPE